jgi:hypothetical protein
MLEPMDSPTTSVAVFAFHDAARTPHVVAAAREQIGVRSVALAGLLADCEIRIIGGVGEKITDARWLALALAVLDGLSGPLSLLAGSATDTDRVTLPDSEDGLATFGRLIPRGSPVILAVVCDETTPSIGAFDRPLGEALFQIPADCAIRMSARIAACDKFSTRAALAS